MHTKHLFISLILATGFALGMLALLNDVPALAAPTATLTPTATITVTNTDDSGPGSLRQAILDANANPGHDTIDIDANGTITLKSALPGITDGLTINGPGAANLAVSGDNAYRVFEINSNNMVTAVTITHLTVQDGAADYGGGIYSSSDLYLIGARVTNNSAVENGGGVYVGLGSATLVGTQVVNNSANHGGGAFVDSGTATLNVSGGEIANNSAKDGGGMYVHYGSAVLAETQVNGNSATSGNGGGVYVDEGNVTLEDTQTINNSAAFGGGVYIDSGATLNVSGGEIANNSAGYSGGMHISGSATLEDTQVIGNSAEIGGGVSIFGSATLVGTQVISNSAKTGGGMFVYGNVTLEDTQVLNNSAIYGDGVFVYEAGAGAAITSTTPLTILGQVYQVGGIFAASSYDLHIDGSLVMTGTDSLFDGTDGLFDAPANFTLTGPFIHTSGTYRQIRDVSGSSDVGFPKAGGVVINANGHSLGSTQVTIHANQDCEQSPTDSETVRRCYAITPTVSSGHDATITFYLNDTELNGNTCTTLDAYRWNGSDWIRHAASSRQCDVSPYSVQVTGVGTVSPQWVLGPKPELGDVNADGAVDIVDAQMTAQYYVGLEPLGFHPDVADVNVDGIVDIVDALIIANYYVGKVPALPWHGPLPE